MLHCHQGRWPDLATVGSTVTLAAVKGPSRKATGELAP